MTGNIDSTVCMSPIPSSEDADVYQIQGWKNIDRYDPGAIPDKGEKWWLWQWRRPPATAFFLNFHLT